MLLLTALSPLTTATGSILPVTTGVASRLFDGLAATRIPFLGPTKAFGEVAGAMVCSGFGCLLGMDDRKRRALDERICSPPRTRGALSAGDVRCGSGRVGYDFREQSQKRYVSQNSKVPGNVGGWGIPYGTLPSLGYFRSFTSCLVPLPFSIKSVFNQDSSIE